MAGAARRSRAPARTRAGSRGDARRLAARRRAPARRRRARRSTPPRTRSRPPPQGGDADAALRARSARSTRSGRRTSRAARKPLWREYARVGPRRGRRRAAPARLRRRGASDPLGLDGPDAARRRSHLRLEARLRGPRARSRTCALVELGAPRRGDVIVFENPREPAQGLREAGHRRPGRRRRAPRAGAAT